MIVRPVEYWDPDDDVDVVLSGGPARIYDNDPEPDLPTRPVGFAPPPAREVEPLLWEGDQA